MAAARRARPKESQQAEPDDKFIAATLEATAWAKRNTQKLVIGIAAVVVLGLVIAYYVGFRQSTETRAANSLEEIQQTLALGDPESAKGRLAQFLDQFGGTPSAGEARLTLAQLYLQTGDPEEAVQVLAPMARDLSAPINQQGAYLLAQAYEDEGRFDAAEDLYLRIANQADLEFQVRDALQAAARIRTRNGDFDGALNLLEELMAGLEPGDPLRPEIEMRIAELEALQAHTS